MEKKDKDIQINIDPRLLPLMNKFLEELIKTDEEMVLYLNKKYFQKALDIITIPSMKLSKAIIDLQKFVSKKVKHKNDKKPK